jgi:hypothetical protein
VYIDDDEKIFIKVVPGEMLEVLGPMLSYFFS